MVTDIATVMEEMPYGVYIVGSHDAAGEPNGMMADWVMQISFEPRMLAVSFENDAHTLANIRTNSSFTVNFLPQDDDGRKLAAKFAQPYLSEKVMGRSDAEKSVVYHKLAEIPYFRTATGCPVLQGACAWLECEAENFVPVGDHTLVAARVTGGQVVEHAEVLTSMYSGWTYSG
jgi:flavin reductase (DIM6/NTAB) family NADH-FMN oxidoreductase RutF